MTWSSRLFHIPFFRIYAIMRKKYRKFWYSPKNKWRLLQTYTTHHNHNVIIIMLLPQFDCERTFRRKCFSYTEYIYIFYRQIFMWRAMKGLNLCRHCYEYLEEWTGIDLILCRNYMNDEQRTSQSDIIKKCSFRVQLNN